MNAARDLHYRLLRLFPVSVVKTAFHLTHRSQHQVLDEVTATASAAEINTFLLDHLGFAKKHVYLFDVPNVDIHALDDIEDLLSAELIDKQVSADRIRYVYLYRHTYDVAALFNADQSFHRFGVAFKQPILVELTATYLTVSLTIVERSPDSYLPDYTVYNAKRRIEDKDVVEGLILKLVETFPPPSIMDINQGIKDMWHNDLIDARAVKYKRDSSIATEIMDEHFTFKERYPQRYQEVIQTPLRKHTFRFLQNHEQFCDFESDPTAGILSFNKYPTEINQIQNVVSEILNKNH